MCVQRNVVFHPAVADWLLNLDEQAAAGDADAEKTVELIEAAINVLRREGPNLGRPLVERVHQSSHQKMKELRPGSAGRTEIRLLFAFDTEQAAFFVVAGDKAAGSQWNRWYSKNVPIADDRLREHQAEIKKAKKKK